MSLVTEIKSNFKGAEVKIVGDNPDCVEIVFGGAQGTVVVTKDPSKELYSASYPSLVRDGRGGYKKEEGFSKGMLLEGTFWLLKQVKKNGLVKPEIMD